MWSSTLFYPHPTSFFLGFSALGKQKIQHSPLSFFGIRFQIFRSHNNAFDRLGFPKSFTDIFMVANVGLDSGHSREGLGRAKGQLCKVNAAFMATCIQKYYFLCDCVFYRSVMECVPYWSHTIVSWQQLSILPNSANDSERLRTYYRRRRTTMQRWRCVFTFVHSHISTFTFTEFYFEIHCLFFLNLHLNIKWAYL